jgi:Tol biopolymer transport system component
MNRLSLFDKIALSSLSLIGLLIGLVVARGDTVGVQIQSTFPENGGLVSAAGRIGITFKQAILADSFLNLLEVQPATAGLVNWEGNTLWFTPDKIFSAGVSYTLHLKPGGLSKDGRLVKHDFYLSFHTRPVQVLYLSLSDQKPDIWRQPLDGGAPVQMTFTGGSVYDYAPSTDGQQIVYSAKNTQGGIDQWLIQRDGSQNRELANCNQDQCMQAAWAPDGKQLVYTRKVTARNSTASVVPGGLYSVVISNGQSTFLFPGGDPSWSPGGHWLVTSDPTRKYFEVLNLNTGEKFQVQATVDEPPTWFPDESKMMYANMDTGVGIPQERLYEVDILNKKVSPILNDDVDQVEYNLPVISPDGQWMVASLHVMVGGDSKQLWLMDVKEKNKNAITHNELITNSYYSWDPWGGKILFQQFELGNSDALPQVMVWDKLTGQIKPLVQGAALPKWMP